MRLGRGPSYSLHTERLLLRPPLQDDYKAWSSLRAASEAFLTPWEPKWENDHLSRRLFLRRVSWARRAVSAGTAVPFFLIRRQDKVLLGAITLDNVRRGPAQAASLGYWIGEAFARQGFMAEALRAVSDYGFRDLDVSRLEAACLPENQASRRLLEVSGFKYEGVAQSYLQIAGRWRTHVLYAALRSDRRGKTDAS